MRLPNARHGSPPPVDQNCRLQTNGTAHRLMGPTSPHGALIAWKTPTTLAPAPDMLLVGAHTDSPCFKLKPNPDVQHYGWHQLAVEVYGGILNNSWLDRDLGLAGRVVNDAGETTLVRTDAIARIPQLAIHLDRGVNEGFALTLRPTSCRSGASTKWESRLLNTYSVSRVLTQLHGGMFRSSTLSRSVPRLGT